MKKLLFTVLTFSFLSFAVIVPTNEKTDTSAPVEKIDFSNITVDDILKLTPSKIEEISGQKLDWKEKIVLKQIQKDFKKKIKNNEVDKSSKLNFEKYFEESENSFNAGGFLLGLLLGLIGVLLAYVFSKDKSLRKSAWVGWGVWLAILLIIVLSA